MIKRVSFVLIGVLAIVLSIITFCKVPGSFESDKEYGGDAYTGIQQASAQAANNIRHLSYITKFGFGSVLLVGGLAFLTIGAFGEKESKTASSDEKADKNQKEESILSSNTENSSSDAYAQIDAIKYNIDDSSIENKES